MKCVDCQWFEYLEGKEFMGRETGNCHKDPPSGLHCSISEGSYSEYRRVGLEDWCSHFKEREDRDQCLEK